MLECSGLAIEQCLEDADCVDGHPPRTYCAGCMGVRCESDDECGDGMVCDRRNYECMPAT